MNRETALFVATTRNIEKNHRRIDECVFGVELRTERPGVVPKGVVGNFDRAVGSNAPRELVQLFNGELASVGGGGNALHMAAEIANLVEGVPGGHLKVHAVFHLGDFDGDVEEMLFGMRERDFVANFRIRRSGEKETSPENNGGREADCETVPGHCAFAPLVVWRAESFFRSFSQRPSKLPLEMIRSKSPGWSSAARMSAMASALGTTRASLPSWRTAAATDSGSRR